MESNDLITPEKAKEIIIPLCNEEVIQSSWNELDYSDTGKFLSGTREFYLTEVSLKQMLGEMGVSKKAFKSLPDRIRKDLIDELLVNKSEMGILLDRDSGNAKQFISLDAPYVNSLSVFQQILDSLNKKKLDPKLQIDMDIDGSVVMNFITSQNHEFKKVGDVVHAGICSRVRINDMLPEIMLGPYAYTLRCSNGMIGKTEKLEVIKAESIDKLMKIIEADVLKWHDDSYNRMIPHFEKLIDINVSDPSRVIHQASKEFKIGSSAKNRLLDKLPSLGDNPSMYHIVDLITSQANEYSPNTRIRLQCLGGRIVDTAECRCPTCRGIL